MKGRTTLFLLAAAALLAAYIVLLERGTPTTGERRAAARKALRIRPEEVTALRLDEGDLTLAVAREGDQWKLELPVKARADRAAVDRLLATLERLERSEVITAAERREKGLSLRDYGLEKPRAVLRVTEAGRERTFRIGRPSALGHALYVQEDGGEAVAAVSTNLLAALPAGAADLRDRSLFGAGDAARVRRLELRRSGGFVQAARGEGSNWTLQQPRAGRADAHAVLSVVEALLGARIEAFVRDGAGDSGAYGFEETGTEITLGFDGPDQPAVTLQLGRPVEDHPGLVYAKRRSGDAVYAVTNALAHVAATPVADLRDRRLVALRPEQIGAVTIREGERLLQLARGEQGRWQIVQPARVAADNERVAALVRLWTGARIEQFVEGSATNAGDFGLSPPAFSIAFGASAEDTHALEVAVSASGNAPAGRRYARQSGEDAVYEIGEAPAAAVRANPLAYRSREMLELQPTDIRSLALARRGAREQHVAIGPESVTAPDAIGARVNEAAVRRLVAMLARLRAAALVSESGEELARFGLDEPAAVLTIGLSGEAGITKTLLLGGRAEGGQYAMIRGQDVVFLLDPARAGMLQGDLYTAPPPEPAPSGPAAETAEPPAPPNPPPPVPETAPGVPAP